ncbi:RidA family protein [Pragia fontium]|uniref:2-iminobutanoate/2-iminopropanoate deaminase n=1 Tax=Pragia fontium DSM 5563 = ATCC 49100 TaxID=1122977 RepID=A0AAJ5BGC1_9GAMM|nr:RidA family protein [Pragia fontium]SFC36074.1 2-iminobutanoate/2-iminopropanoate deaminase [Pragia fontium DSM 5563 = ATCC 49100]SUB81982.1 Enamine/imine deaminase [Pragia fontium]VEJ54571.1 Enamine/imine deaminase [Pragia fontium]
MLAKPYAIVILSAALFFTGLSQAAERKVIMPKGDEPSRLYSPGIEANGFIFTSGQLAIDPTSGKLVEGIEAQTRLALANLRRVLEAGGSSMDKLVKVNVYLSNIDDYAAMNKIYAESFNGAPPVRTALQVGKIPLGALIEIEGIALK